MDMMKQYLTYSEKIFTPEETEKIREIMKKYNFQGTEIFMNEAYPRTQKLFASEREKIHWIDKFSNLCVKRIHCSYWAYPTHFLTKTHFKEFAMRMDGVEGIRKYYGDVKGSALYQRWIQEYELACALEAQSFVFHLIDYAAVDGVWEFCISREEILQAMVGMVQTLLICLEDRNLLSSSSPLIEIENAGWGLEYGAQRWEDFEEIFNQIDDPWNKVRIGWDINHLLHAIGVDETGHGACFMLQEHEITREMAKLERDYGSNAKEFAMKWIEDNLLAPALSGKVGCLHLSDCALKSVEYFKNGRLQGEYGETLDSLKGKKAKSDYGIKIVLDMYDSHIPMGTQGVVLQEDMKRILRNLHSQNSDLVLLHELKNSAPLFPALEKQLEFLRD